MIFIFLIQLQTPAMQSLCSTFCSIWQWQWQRLTMAMVDIKGWQWQWRWQRLAMAKVDDDNGWKWQRLTMAMDDYHCPWMNMSASLTIVDLTLTIARKKGRYSENFFWIFLPVIQPAMPSWSSALWIRNVILYFQKRSTVVVIDKYICTSLDVEKFSM